MEKTCTLPSWGFAKLFNYPAVENYTMPLNIAYTHLPIQLNSGIYTNATETTCTYFCKKACSDASYMFC